MGAGDGADFCAFLLKQFGENGEARATEMLGAILHLDRVAQVGLVGAIPFGGVTIGDLRPFGIDFAPAAELFKDTLHHRLDGVEHVLLGDKAHLEVELVKVGR